MKYIAIIETDDFEDFEFFEDGLGKYIRGIDAAAVNNEWIPLYFTEYKQESILDKVRNELINVYPKNYAGELESDGNVCYFSLNKIFEIIDKYKAESEDKE